MLKTYKFLKKQTSTFASAVLPGDIVLIHIERWNGSYEMKIVASESTKNGIVLTSDTNHRHTVPEQFPVVVREYITKEGLNE